MIKKIFTFLILMFFIPFIVEAYEVKQDWQKGWGGDGYDYTYSIHSTSDDGYVICGYSTSSTIGDQTNKGSGDAIIAKFNSNGELEWNRNWGGSSSESFEDFIFTENDEIVVVGYSYLVDVAGLSSNGNTDAIIVKYDKDGNMLWQKNLGGKGSEYFYSVDITSSGEYVATGYMTSTNMVGITNNGAYEFLTAKYDKDGNLLWKKNFGGSGNDKAYSVVLSDDDEIFVSGSSNSTNIDGMVNKGNLDAVLIKYDKDGNLLWKTSFSGNDDESFEAIMLTDLNEIIAVGYSKSTDIENLSNKGDKDALIVKFDKDGKLMWQKSWGGSGVDHLKELLLDLDGSFYVVGNFNSIDIENMLNLGYYDAMILKYDKDGNLLWQKNWGGNSSDYFNSILFTDDGGFITIGEFSSFNISGIQNFDKYDASIVKYSIDFNINILETENGLIKVEQQGKYGVIKPTPNDGYVVDDVSVKDSSGNEVKTSLLQDGTYLFALCDDVSIKTTFIKDYKILKQETKKGNVEVIKKTNTLGLITLTPDEGYEVDKIIVKNTKNEVIEVTKLEDGIYSFSLDDDVSVEVLFKEMVVNPKTGVIDIISTLLVGFVISFIGYTLVKKNCYQYDL